ncbi:MAG: glycosyltransferase [Anaerolineales bacterium]|jgi:glycosyltransferase involved in cell wall biosynthesis|nr:glycosyltransferase [Anaerolineales bacterium]
MLIGMLTDTYKPYISGVTNHVALTKRALETRGHKVCVFTFGRQNYVDDEIDVIRSPAVPLADTGYNLSFRYNRRAQRKLAGMDVAHVHHPFASGRLALRYCQNRKIPIVFTNHTRYDLYAQAYLPHLPEAIPEAFLQAFLPSFCRQCDLVIAPSPSLAKLLLGYGVDAPIEIVPNGVDLSGFRQKRRGVQREDIGLDNGDRVLIFVGRLGPEKNLTMLLRAFAGAEAAVENLRLIIVGDGPERDNLRDWCKRSGINDHVRFIGKVAYPTVPDYLQLSDAFITASVSEVHPLSIIEGMAVGLPAIGIQSPGVGDIIQDGVNGILCGNDLAVFTAHLVRLMLDDTLLSRLAAGAIARAEQYDIRQTADELLRHYQDISSNRTAVSAKKRSRGGISKFFQ